MAKRVLLGLGFVGGALAVGLFGLACATDARTPLVLNGGGQAGDLPDSGAIGVGVGGELPAAGGGQAGSDGSAEVALPDATLGPCIDGATRDCGVAEGECEFGTQSCVGRVWVECVGGVGPKARDCASPLDNDCDGQVDNQLDEVCACVPGDVDSECGTRERFGKGLCAPGTRECQLAETGVGSTWSACVGEVGPAGAADRCDVVNDDNCDGTENDGCPCVLGRDPECGPDTEEGICSRGSVACEGGVLGACNAVFPRARDCSSDQDNDCNGLIDIDELAFCRCVIGESEACNEHPGQDGEGRCRSGTRSCEGQLEGTRSEFGACVGSVGPLPNDSCAVSGDDSNCDGIPNGGCACIIDAASSCANPDTQNCSVQCVRDGSDSSSRCVLSARDRDGDGASSCSVAPSPGGLDCDDDDETVRPGALEICNGVDDDCDGNIDLGNELAVAGTTLRMTETPAADVAFSPSDGGFRYAAQNGLDRGVAFGIINRNGAFNLASVDVNSAQSQHRDPRIAALGNEFGIVYTRPARVDPEFNPAAAFSRVSANGDVLSTITLTFGASDAGLAASSAGWVTGFSRVSRGATELLELGRVNAAADTYTMAASRPEENLGQSRIALIGNAGAVIWQSAYSIISGDRLPAPIRFARFDVNLAITGTITNADTRGAHPDITALGSSYFMAWAVGGGVRYQRVGSNGMLACSGSSSFGNGVLDNEDAVAVEPTPNGVVLLATDAGGGDVGVFVYDQDCRELEHALIPVSPSSPSPSPRQPEAPSLAQGAGDIVFAWTEGGVDSVFRRTTTRICE